MSENPAAFLLDKKKNHTVISIMQYIYQLE